VNLGIVRKPEQDFTLETVGIGEEDAVRAPEIGDETVARAVGDEPPADLDERVTVGGLEPHVIDRAVTEHRTAHEVGGVVAVHLEDVELGARTDVDERQRAGADLFPVGDGRLEHLLVEPHEAFGVVGDDRHMVYAVEQHDSSVVAPPRIGSGTQNRDRTGASVQSTPEGAPASGLAALLDLEVLDRDLFRGENEQGATSRLSLYGGQVAAQALRAAGATVPADRLPHSMHGYFLRRGQVDRPVILHVDRDRDGGSFSARHVRAVQDGEVIFSMVASFHAREESASFDGVPTRGAPDASTLRSRPSPFLVEVREVTPTRIGDGQVRHSDSLWVRASSPLPDDPLVHACAVTYVSDLGSGFGQVEVPDLPAGGPSIDHSLWFQEPIRADEWMLLELWPLKATSSRGVYSGSLRSADGALGALLTQEMLLRGHELPPDMLHRIAEYLGVTPE
jgi:acyl-CoA thioesterase II